jgi:hypothetical protein
MSWTTALRAACPGVWRMEEPLSRHTTIRVGGPAEAWYEPADAAALAKAVRMVREVGVRHGSVMAGGWGLRVAVVNGVNSCGWRWGRATVPVPTAHVLRPVWRPAPPQVRPLCSSGECWRFSQRCGDA